VHVRPAGAADIQTLIELTEDNGVAEHVGRRVRAADGSLAERFHALLEDTDRLVLVAVDEESDHVVGYAAMAEEQIGVIVPTTTLYISHLLVAPKFRRRGVGRALLAAAVRHAEDRDIDHVVVGVQSSARDAHRYLARLGFAPLTVRRIATVPTLRRTLGIVDTIDRVALRRRRTVRGVIPTRVSRGA
jgi:ribosomal protein S18 acetylase RimI-like enzyme